MGMFVQYCTTLVVNISSKRKKFQIALAAKQDEDMKAFRILFLLFSIKWAFCNVEKEEKSTFLKYFINNSTKYLIICNLNGVNDLVIDEFVTIAYDFGIWTRNWQCDVEDIPDAQNALMIINEINEEQFNDVLMKENIQKSLRTNTWLIYTSDSEKEAKSYFKRNPLQIGINVQIFFVKYANDIHSVTQILGTATLDLKFRALNHLDLMDFANIQESVKTKADFEGAPILANFVESFLPYCYLDNFGDLVGMFPDTLRIAANYLNLTLIFQETKEENTDIWASRYKINKYDNNE